MNRYRIICTEYIVHIHLLVFIISDNCLLLETFCFYRTCLFSISDSLFISRIILFLQDNTVVPATPLFSAKILQEDKDMWLDVQVIILAALMSAVLSNSYLFVKDFYLYIYLSFDFKSNARCILSDTLLRINYRGILFLWSYVLYDKHNPLI